MSKKYVIPESQLSFFDDTNPKMPILDTSRCEVKPINYETAARMVETYHYAKRVPSIKYSIGLYIDNVLSGCVTYSTVFKNIGGSICGDDYATKVLELSRLYTFDYVPRNTESWFISNSYKILQTELPEYVILLSYADSGQNHIGYIYQALNWYYTGMSDGTTEFVLNGEVVSARNRAFRKDKGRKGGADGGLISYEELKEMYPGIEKIRTSPKYRYVYFLGSKSQKRTLRKALKWDVLPYPKS